MSHRLLTSVIVVSFIIIASAGSVCAYTELNTATAIRAEGQIPFTPGPILDDFGNAAPVNKWGATTGTFVGALDASGNPISPDANTKCVAFYTGDTGIVTPPVSGNVLQLDYNVNATNNYAGYSSRLYSGSPSQDLSGYNAISFYVKGKDGGEFFKIQLKKGDSTMASLYISDYLDGGVTTIWQKVTIPFHNFVNLGNVGQWGNMAEFGIVFEQYSCDVNSSRPKVGTIYVDDIKFENLANPAVRIDYFGDKLGVCALGGNIGTGVSDSLLASGNNSSFSGSVNEYDPPYPYGLKLNYDVSSVGAYAYTFIIFGGGADGWTAVSHDFSTYTNITFRARAESDAKNPKTMKLELAYGTGDNSTYVLIDAPAFGGALTTSWKTYTIPLSAFPLLNSNPIKKLTFTLEGWRIGNAGGSKIGTVLIDSVQFE